MNDKRTYYVYKHTAPNGKVYIGITCQKPQYRWNSGNGYRQNKHFYDAIKKYGWDNIQHEIICSGLSRVQACLIESDLISLFNSNDARFGYNNTSGGDCNYSVSNETLKKMSKITSSKWKDKRWRANQLQKRSAKEFRNNLSNKSKRMWASPTIRKSIINKLKSKWDDPIFREEQSEILNQPERIEKIRKAVKKRWINDTEYRDKMVSILNERWKKESEHAKAIKCLKNRWANEEYRDAHTGGNSPLAKSILQYDKDGNLINKYACVSDAEKSLNIPKAVCHISACANGKRKTAYGYIWKYA